MYNKLSVSGNIKSKDYRLDVIEELNSRLNFDLEVFFSKVKEFCKL